MPIVTVTLRAGRPAHELQTILQAVHDAMVEALRIPAQARNQRLLEIPAELYYYPEGRSADYLSVEIAAVPGRSAESKAALYPAICDRLQQALAISKEDVVILIHEPPPENWGINGAAAG